MNKTKQLENKAYKVTLIVLVGLAAFSTAMRDLNRLREMVSSVHGFTSQWQGTDLVMLDDTTISTPVSTPFSPTGSCPNKSLEPINSAAGSGESDGTSQATDNEIDSIDYDTVNQPELGGKAELLASTKMNRNVPQLARARYAAARTPRNEISARRRDSDWPAHFEFKTNDRVVTLDLPLTMIHDMKADDFEGEVSPDFPLSLLGRTNRKQSHGKTDNGRREIMIKRLERSFSSRRAS
ncbi:MAG: hypothetical protein ABR568_04935 [Pyrinomonadaceae bacterium]